MTRRPVALLVVWLVLAAGSAAAQPWPFEVKTPPATGLLTRSDFSFSLALLGTSDPRFSANGRLTADVDVLDYGAGRARMYIDYEGVLGSERHDFDLNHGNYVLETSFSKRFGTVEVAGVYHHVSRHLNDREHAGSISWNVLGARVSHRFTFGASTLDGEVDTGFVHEPHYVDYSWINELTAVFRHPLNEHASFFAGADGTIIQIDKGQVRDHGPCGARLEAGVRIKGRATEVELFVSYERRIDGYPTERNRVRFIAAGFRLFS